MSNVGHISEVFMQRQFTLEYWLEDDWYVGRLKEIPGVFSQGQSLQELEDNIQDAYDLMLADVQQPDTAAVQVKEVNLEV
jgi:predicted RNase H-like HicB family nuclease